MFFKGTEKLESFVGNNCQVKGEMKTQGTLRIDGRFEGSVGADWIVIGEKAYLKGDATVRGIVVGGVVDGNITADEIIEIKQKGQVKGDIITARLTVAEGGILQGRITMKTEQAQVIEFTGKVVEDS